MTDVDGDDPDDSQLICPYCGDNGMEGRDCGHLLLVVNVTDPQSLGGVMYEWFDGWLARLASVQHSGHKPARESRRYGKEFESMLAVVAATVDRAEEFDCENFHAGHAEYRAYYCSSRERMTAAMQLIQARKHPVSAA